MGRGRVAEPRVVGDVDQQRRPHAPAAAARAVRILVADRGRERLRRRRRSGACVSEPASKSEYGRFMSRIQFAHRSPAPERTPRTAPGGACRTTARTRRRPRDDRVVVRAASTHRAATSPVISAEPRRRRFRARPASRNVRMSRLECRDRGLGPDDDARRRNAAASGRGTDFIVRSSWPSTHFIDCGTAPCTSATDSGAPAGLVHSISRETRPAGECRERDAEATRRSRRVAEQRLRRRHRRSRRRRG